MNNVSSERVDDDRSMFPPIYDSNRGFEAWIKLDIYKDKVHVA